MLSVSDDDSNTGELVDQYFNQHLQWHIRGNYIQCHVEIIPPLPQQFNLHKLCHFYKTSKIKFLLNGNFAPWPPTERFCSWTSRGNTCNLFSFCQQPIQVYIVCHTWPFCWCMLPQLRIFAYIQKIWQICQCMQWNVKKLKLFGIKGLCNQKRWKPVRGGLTYAHGTHARYEKILFLKNILKK